MTDKLTCTTCGATKPVDEFGVRSGTTSGRRSQCKACYRRKVNQRPPRERDRSDINLEPPLPVARWLVEREEWQENGRCRQKNTDMFFPRKGGNWNLPKLICQSCPVQFQCLEYAMRTDQRFGIWGGKSEKERQDIRSRRRKEQMAS